MFRNYLLMRKKIKCRVQSSQMAKFSANLVTQSPTNFNDSISDEEKKWFFMRLAPDVDLRLIDEVQEVFQDERLAKKKLIIRRNLG
jgi:hypothetical protein